LCYCVGENFCSFVLRKLYCSAKNMAVSEMSCQAYAKIDFPQNLEAEILCKEKNAAHHIVHNIHFGQIITIQMEYVCIVF